VVRFGLAQVVIFGLSLPFQPLLIPIIFFGLTILIGSLLLLLPTSLFSFVQKKQNRFTYYNPMQLPTIDPIAYRHFTLFTLDPIFGGGFVNQFFGLLIIVR
jgi:hypothetical protein